MGSEAGTESQLKGYAIIVKNSILCFMFFGPLDNYSLKMLFKC